MKYIVGNNIIRLAFLDRLLKHLKTVIKLIGYPKFFQGSCEYLLI
jgi:hypothetical protein